MNIWKWLSNKLKEQDEPSVDRRLEELQLDIEELRRYKGIYTQALHLQASADGASLTKKLGEIEKRMEDQAKEIEGLRIDFKGLEERTDKEIQFCLKDIQTLSMKEKQ
jgi:hypothetical protein